MSLGRALYLPAPLGTNENEGTGQGGLFEATFSPDSLDVVALVGQQDLCAHLSHAQGCHCTPESFQLENAQAGLLEGKVLC